MHKNASSAQSLWRFTCTAFWVSAQWLVAVVWFCVLYNVWFLTLIMVSRTTGICPSAACLYVVLCLYYMYFILHQSATKRSNNTDIHTHTQRYWYFTACLWRNRYSFGCVLDLLLRSRTIAYLMWAMMRVSNPDFPKPRILSNSIICQPWKPGLTWSENWFSGLKNWEVPCVRT